MVASGTSTDTDIGVTGLEIPKAVGARDGCEAKSVSGSLSSCLMDNCCGLSSPNACCEGSGLLGSVSLTSLWVELIKWGGVLFYVASDVLDPVDCSGDG